MARLNIRVQPRASANEVSGFNERGVLRVRVTAPPSDGQANEAVIRLLSKSLNVGRSRVQIVRGASAREKTVEIDGLTEAEVRRLLEAPGLS